MADVKNVVDFEYRVSGAGEAAAGMNQMAGSGIIVANMAVQLAHELSQVAGQIKAVFDETVALNSALWDSSQAAGIDVESFQALDYIFRQNGGSAGDAATAIRALTSALVSGGEEGTRKREAIEELGLSYQHIIDMAPGDAFTTIADAIGGLSTAQERNLALNEIFGGRYSQMIAGVLNQSTDSVRQQMDAFRESNLLISGDTVQAYDALADAQVKLEQRMNVLKAEGLLPLVPVAEDIMDIWSELAEDIAPELAEALTNVAWGFGQVLGVVKELNEDGGELPEWLQDTAKAVQYAQNPFVLLNDALGQLRRNAEEAHPPITDLNTIMEIHAGVLANLNREEVLAAHAAYVFAESNLVILASMSGFSSAFDEQIQRIRDMRAEMEAIAITLTGTTFDVEAPRITGGGGVWRKDEREDEWKKAVLTEKELLDLNLERLAIQQQMIEASRAAREDEIALMERIADKEAAAYQERMAPVLSIAQQTTDILVSGMTRGFDNIGDQFKNMLVQMAADWLKSTLFRALVSGAGKAGGFFL